MTDTTKVISTTNVTLGHSANVVNRANAMGIALELIKSCAASGSHINNVESALKDLGAWTDYIYEEMKKNGK